MKAQDIRIRNIRAEARDDMAHWARAMQAIGMEPAEVAGVLHTLWEELGGMRADFVREAMDMTGRVQ